MRANKIHPTDDVFHGGGFLTGRQLFSQSHFILLFQNHHFMFSEVPNANTIGFKHGRSLFHLAQKLVFYNKSLLHFKRSLSKYL